MQRPQSSKGNDLGTFQTLNNRLLTVVREAFIKKLSPEFSRVMKSDFTHGEENLMQMGVTMINQEDFLEDLGYRKGREDLSEPS